MRDGIYRVCLETVSRAVLSGVCCEREAWHMTPGELSRKAEAHRRAQAERMKEMDMLAWLIGQYAAVGINSPGRYPRQPDRVRERAAGDDEMKWMMMDMARRSRKEGGK